MNYTKEQLDLITDVANNKTKYTDRIAEIEELLKTCTNTGDRLTLSGELREKKNAIRLAGEYGTCGGSKSVDMA